MDSQSANLLQRLLIIQELAVAFQGRAVDEVIREAEKGIGWAFDRALLVVRKLEHLPEGPYLSVEREQGVYRRVIADTPRPYEVVVEGLELSDPQELRLVALFLEQLVAALRAAAFQEALEKANYHKSAFLANMSHEIRTPLTAILGFSELLGDEFIGPLSPEQHEYVGNVLSAGRHLLGLINDVLDISKVEAGKMALHRSDADLVEIIAGVCVVLRERAESARVTLDTELPDSLQLSIDPRKIKQVLYNYLSNAIKYTPAHSRVLTRLYERGDNVVVEVRDSGPGISEADQEKLFREFSQLDNEHQKEGTGLGLALSRAIVELHGGAVWVDSEPGAGSTFGFALPSRPTTTDEHAE